MVDGDPLVNIANAHKVRRVIANGRVYELNGSDRPDASAHQQRGGTVGIKVGGDEQRGS